VGRLAGGPVETGLGQAARAGALDGDQRAVGLAWRRKAEPRAGDEQRREARAPDTGMSDIEAAASAAPAIQAFMSRFSLSLRISGGLFDHMEFGVNICDQMFCLIGYLRSRFHGIDDLLEGSLVAVEALALTADDGAADRVAAAISRLIVDGQFGPGDRLKLSDLATRFGVSLMPVREALWKLEGSGLVQNIPNRGAVVRAVDAQHIINVYELRGAIEAALVERAVGLATSPDLDRIESARHEVERAVKQGEPRAILLTDAAFHEAINQVASNDLATAMLRGTMPLIQSMRLRVGFVPGRLAAMLSEHAEIVAAIREGDGRLAAQRVRLHTNGARQAMLTALQALDAARSRRRRQNG
jgi:DNA-binding GntR family transcriptional regulator